MAVTTINLYPLYQLAIAIGVMLVIGIIAFLIHNGFNINLFVKKDEHIADEFLKRFPLVSREFYCMTSKEQLIENNQEIHENNIEIYELKKNIEELKKTINTLQWDIEICKKK